ncbi:MAG: thioredoxin family protein [Planctomycetota bacterium]|nr:thioredoxin family protein [Planctomycetota bacterium]MCX8040412.1 thioredoxin family protein [Planctomycetota bacterium]MDW8372212.1 thioredoxin family protein [Planctomycetota bacterium]
MLRLLALFTFTVLTALTGGEWLVGWQNAAARARAENKLILANFTGSDWCGWCIRLKSEVFDTAEFAAWAKEKVVPLVIDFPMRSPLPPAQARENEELQNRYRIQGYPTIVILRPDGSEVGRLGYVRGGAAAWIAAAEKIIGGAR